MADLTYSDLPVAGTVNNAADVVTPLNEVKAYVNASQWVDTERIKDANVTTAKIADANVTTAKVADSAITTAKIANANVTTAKIADGAITAAKLATAYQQGAQLSGGYAGSSSGCYTSNNGTYQTLPGMSITVTGDNANPIWLEFYISAAGGPRNERTIYSVRIYDSTASATITEGGGVDSSPLAIRARVAPFSGSKTFVVQDKILGSNYPTPGFGMLGENSPEFAYLRATWG